MKKLMMFAAAMTIVGGAFAQCGDPEIPEVNCALVYDVKASVKTTVGDSKAGYTVASNCGDSTNIAAATCFRKIGKKTLQGFLFTCDCECDAIESADMYLWNKKEKVFESGSMSWDFINIIGKKQKDVEGSWKITLDGTGSLGAGTIYGAGFGKWDSKKEIVKSLSGNFAGYLEAPECDDELSCDAAAAYVCTDLLTPDSSLDTAAFGTWSIKYSSSKSKKLAADASAYIDWLPDYL